MEKTSTSPFDEIPAPNPILHPHESQSAFHETNQPSGVQFQTFLLDFIFDEIPEKRRESLDANSILFRRMILQAENGGVPFELVGIELVLKYQLPEEGEVWTISI